MPRLNAMVDRTVYRLIIFGLIYSIKLTTSYVLLLQVGEVSFEAIFTTVSLLSFATLALFGFPNGGKTLALQQKKQYGEASTAVFVFSALNVTILVICLISTLLLSEYSFAITIFGTRLVLLFEEIKRELLGFQYVARFSFFGETLLLFIILSGLPPVLLLLVGAVYYFYTTAGRFRVSTLNDARKFVAGSVGKRPAILECSSVLLFGLDVFWAAIFMNSGQFVAYFFIGRIFSGISVLFGGLTRNYWAQGFLTSNTTSKRMIKESLVLAWALSAIGALAALVVITAFKVLIPENIQNATTFNDLVVIIGFQFVFLCIQLVNRVQKNNITMKNRLLEIANVNFLVSLLMTMLLCVGAYTLPENIIFFFMVKISIFCLLIYCIRRVAKDG